MCDFMSACYRAEDGAESHVPSNSHSEAIQSAGWLENDERNPHRYIECEWDGRGEFSLERVVSLRNSMTLDMLTNAQFKAITRRYKALAAFLADADAPLGMFSGPEWIDVVAERVRRLKLTSVTLPDGITTIGNGAFRGCTGLTSIPAGITTIGNWAFRGCTGLTSIPAGITTIGDWAFRGCTGLTIETKKLIKEINRYGM